jgi:hypothetical protein
MVGRIFMTGTRSSPDLRSFDRFPGATGIVSLLAAGGVVIDLTMDAGSSGRAETIATVIG